jgi:hypothetical protein
MASMHDLLICFSSVPLCLCDELLFLFQNAVLEFLRLPFGRGA